MGNKRIESIKATAEAGHPASSARIRENQRRSRARRKEYLRDLEQRLRRFESLGVEATLEVQAAGRKVAAENALLRVLLRRHGVTEEEIREYLKSHTTGHTLCDQSSREARPPANSLTLTTRGDRQLGGSIAQSNTRHPKYDNPLSETTARGDVLSPLSDSDAKYQGNLLRYQLSSAEQPSDKRYTGQTTPCETAARIIMTMRGCPDIRDVRSELGCHSESNCMVRNMDVFEILDK